MRHDDSRGMLLDRGDHEGSPVRHFALSSLLSLKRRMNEGSDSGGILTLPSQESRLPLRGNSPACRFEGR
jgi:hypothetical protein